MTDMQRWDMNHVQGEVYIDKNPEGSWVRFTDAEAAISAARADMLAKCIALGDSHITRLNNEAASEDDERFANELYANADGIEFIVGELGALEEKP